MGIFDRFKSKKEKELKNAEAPKEQEIKKSKNQEIKEPDMAQESKKAKKQDVTEVKKTLVDVSGVLKAPVVTEKTAHEAGAGRYAFEVNGRATKIDVRRAVEKTYGVHVTGVSVQNVRGKAVRFGRTLGKRSSWKKAVVSLKSGERLDIYEASAKS